MLFNSFIFLIFILVFFIGWPIARKYNNSRWGYIVFFSFIFYGWWDWRFLFLMIGNGLINFLCSIYLVKKPKYKKAFATIAIVGNIGILGLFKYSGFIAHELDYLIEALGQTPFFFNSIPPFALILPAGISFYTFESMNYTIDVYRGKLKPSTNILQFYSFLSMFPRLLAGPIIRAKTMLAQLDSYRIPSLLEKWHAVKLITLGYFQKVVLADNIAPLVNRAFQDDIDIHNPIYWWTVMLGFSLQILFDFAGYSLIARGLGKLMGYHFSINFNHPYLSFSLKEFWERWHISLSTWFRDYVYIPLGGSRKGKFRGHINMWITMIISGIWHGASFNFIIWGGIHAGLVSIERITRWPKMFMNSFVLRFISWGLVCLQLVVAWVFFRADNLPQAFSILKHMFVWTNALYSIDFVNQFNNSILFIFIGILYEFIYLLMIKYKHIGIFMKTSAVEALLYALLFLSCIFFRGPEGEFIYFQF